MVNLDVVNLVLVELGLFGLELFGGLQVAADKERATQWNGAAQKCGKEIIQYGFHCM